MIERFEVILLMEAHKFVERQDIKTRKKILKNLNRARFHTDPKLIKKLEGDIWEFRTLHRGIQYRLLAFWDKSDAKRTLVLATHGIIKKTSKLQRKEIEKASNIRARYFKTR